MFYFITILSSLAYLVIPVLLIVFLIMRSKNKNKSALEDLINICLSLVTFTTGLIGIGFAPNAFFNIDNPLKSTTALAIYLSASMLLLISGVLLKGRTGKLLMIMGIFLLAMSIIPSITNFGSLGLFLVVFLVFIVLVGTIIKVSKKENHGQNS